MGLSSRSWSIPRTRAIFRPKAEATRRAFFDRVIAEKGMIAGYHFGFPNVGTLSKDGKIVAQTIHYTVQQKRQAG